MGIFDKTSSNLRKRITAGIDAAQGRIDEGFNRARGAVGDAGGASASMSAESQRNHGESSIGGIGNQGVSSKAGGKRCPYCGAELNRALVSDGRTCPYCDSDVSGLFLDGSDEVGSSTKSHTSPIVSAKSGFENGQASLKSNRKPLFIGLACAFALLLVFGFGSLNRAPQGETKTITPQPAGKVFDVHFDIDYGSNLLFDRYDVEVKVDDSVVGTVAQGGKLTRDMPLEEGQHKVRFYKKGKTKAYAESEISIGEEAYYECSIKAHSSEIDINGERVETAAAHEARLAEEQAAKEQKEAEKKQKEAEEKEKEAKKQAEQEKADAEKQAEKEKADAEKKAAAEEKERKRQEEETKAAHITECKGMKAAKAKTFAEECGFDPSFVDKDGKDLTSLVANDNKKLAVKKAEVTEVKTSEGWFGGKYVTLTLDYSAEKRIKSCEGKTAAKAASLAANNGYDAEFYDKSGDEITDEVIGDDKIEAARNAIVTKVKTRSSWGDYAEFTLDYGVPKEYKTALRKAQSYVDNLHMSKAGLYDQMTSEYGEQYSAEAAQYAVDNVKADWKENALQKAREYQEYMDMSPAAIYDQLISYYGEQFTPEEAQYAIDNL